MYHQIRRMIGLVIQLHLAPKNSTWPYNPSSIGDAMNLSKRLIWTAPASGLLLASIEVDRYNAKLDRLGMQNLSLDDSEQQSVRDFKCNTIYPTVVQSEHGQRVFGDWLEGLADPDFTKVRHASFVEVFGGSLD